VGAADADHPGRTRLTTIACERTERPAAGAQRSRRSCERGAAAFWTSARHRTPTRGPAGHLGVNRAPRGATIRVRQHLSAPRIGHVPFPIRVIRTVHWHRSVYPWPVLLVASRRRGDRDGDPRSCPWSGATAHLRTRHLHWDHTGSTRYGTAFRIEQSKRRRRIDTVPQEMPPTKPMTRAHHGSVEDFGPRRFRSRLGTWTRGTRLPAFRLKGPPEGRFFQPQGTTRFSGSWDHPARG